MTCFPIRICNRSIGKDLNDVYVLDVSIFGDIFKFYDSLDFSGPSFILHIHFWRYIQVL